MSSTRGAAALVALALLAGCGGAKSSSTRTDASTASTTTSTPPAATRSGGEISAALLSTADVPGSAVSTASPQNPDLSPCLPGNPFATRTDPTEVKSPGLVTDVGGNRQYGSRARQATPEEAKAFVAMFGSEAGSACVVEAFKKLISGDAVPPKVNSSGLTGTATKAAVADGGALLTVTGQLKAGGEVAAVDTDLLVFQKGPVVAFLSVSAVQGPKVPNQTLALARVMADRLP